MKYLRYYYEFLDRENTRYRVEILQESDTPYTPQEVTLAADPVVIEWPEVPKFEPVMPSAATLRLVSMSDRQFIDLYTVEACSIRMDVYRAGALYWSGTLDTELYEEPYSQLDRYITEVTFSDFGVLERLEYTLTGLVPLLSIIEDCLSAAAISYRQIVEDISTTISGHSGNILESCLVSSENFYDENGEAWSLREVLDEVLRPFALQLRQKNGEIHIFDLNALNSQDAKIVEWRNADSHLGVEPVYNKVQLTFSPYSNMELFDGAFDEEKILPNPNSSGVTTMLVPLPETDFGGFKMYYDEPTPERDVQGVLVGGSRRLFRIEPDNNGEETAGIMWGARPIGEAWSGSAPAVLGRPQDVNNLFGVVLRSPRITIQGGGFAQNIKVELDVLYDPRMNPYDTADSQEDEAWKNFNHWANWGAIPCKLILYATDGETYSYDNSALWSEIGVNFKGSFSAAYAQHKGRWHPGDSGILWLAYYNEGDRKSSTGFGGWQTNKQNIGYWTDAIPRSISLNIQGETIPLPPRQGELQLTVCGGISALDNDGNPAVSSRVAEISRWLLYRNPRISVASYSGEILDLEDIVYTAWLNKSAKEEITIETYVGTPTQRTPLARGSLLSAGDYSVIERFTRAGVTDGIEKLLIGSIYSNYASRHLNLQGTIKIIAEDMILSDNFWVNSRFCFLSLRESLERAEAEIKIAEFSNDQYEAIEYEV